MSCLRHVPYKSCRMTVYRQLFPAGSVPNRLLSSPRRTISSTTAQSQQQEQEQETPKAKQPKKNKSKTAKPRPSDALPSSPLLTDPHVAPVTKHRKPPPSKEDHKLYEFHPWVRTLASPIRMCSITGVRAPRDLLATWGLVQRPKSQGLWFLPIELLKGEVTWDGAPNSDNPNAKLKYGQRPARVLTRTGALRHLSLRLINSIQLLRRLNLSLRSHEIGKFSALSKAIPQRHKHPMGPLTTRDERSLVWRQDMPEFVLEQFRAEVKKRLRMASTRKGGRVWSVIETREGPLEEDALRSGLEGLEKIERMECGSVVVLKNPKGVPLPRLMTLPQTGSRVPVFDLTRLLSDSDLEELLEAVNSWKFQHTALFLRPADPVAFDAMMILWKLQGFLNEDLQFH